MKRLFGLALLTLMLVGCGERSPSTPPVPVAPDAGEPSAAPSPTAATPDVTIDEFTFAQIQGEGCGMALWKPDRTSRDRFIFFNVFDSEGTQATTMEMMLNGTVVPFRRVAASGDAFYGQYTSQTFESQDGTYRVEVTVTLGERGEIENVAIADGTLRLTQNDAAIDIPVVGDAGC